MKSNTAYCLEVTTEQDTFKEMRERKETERRGGFKTRKKKCVSQCVKVTVCLYLLNTASVCLYASHLLLQHVKQSKHDAI